MNQAEVTDPIPERNTSPRGDDARPYDVLVVGAGIAGLTLATAAARAGLSALVVAARDAHPREFRAEKFSAAEMAILDRLGLGAGARAACTPLDTVSEGRWGRLVKRMASQEFAFRYPDFVDAVRAALPPGVASVTGRVTETRTGCEVQTLTLSDGRRFSGRLLVVATGLGEGLQRQLGFEREAVSQGNTLVFGFNTALTYALLAGEQLIWSSETGGDGIAYLTLFPLKDQIRANLFTYWPRGSAAAEAFLADPAGTLRRMMPGLTRAYGSVEPVGAVQQRPIDIVRIVDPIRDGVVVIGDAFCTTCPAYGTGLRKALSDVSVLASLLPAWFASPGIGAAKIESYYRHPRKLAADDLSVGTSLRLRRMQMGTDVVSRFLNLRSTVYRRGQQAVLDAAARLRRSKRPQPPAQPAGHA